MIETICALHGSVYHSTECPRLTTNYDPLFKEVKSGRSRLLQAYDLSVPVFLAILPPFDTTQCGFLQAQNSSGRSLKSYIHRVTRCYPVRIGEGFKIPGIGNGQLHGRACEICCICKSTEPWLPDTFS